MTDSRPDEALRQSEERLSIAKRAAGIGIHDYDPQTGVIQWDERVRELWGIGPDTPIDYGVFLDALHPDDREPTERAIARALDPTGDGYYRAEYRVVSRRDGITRWVAATGMVTFDAGRPVRLVGTVQDVSASRAAEVALKASEERLRLALTWARAGAWEWDLRSDVVVWSPELYGLLGVDTSQVPSFELFASLIHPDDRGRVSEEFGSIARHGGVFDLEFRVVRPTDGVVLWLSSVGRVDRDEAGRPRVARGINRDVSARRAAQQALQRSEASLRAALELLSAQRSELQLIADHAPLFLARCDPEGRFLFVNRAYAERFGTTVTEVLGKRIPEVVGDAAYETFRRYVERATAGERVDFELAIPYATGTRIMQCSYVPETPASSDALPVRTSFVAVIQDVTERRAADAALRRSQEHLRLASDAAGLGIWAWDVGSDVLAWENDRAFEILGVERSEAPMTRDRLVAELLHPDDVVLFERAVTATTAAGLHFHFEGRIRSPHGRWRWIELNGAPNSLTAGSPARVLGTMSDVTERRLIDDQRQRALEASAKFRTVFDQGMQFAVVLNLDGTVIEANRVAVDGCGYDRDAILGRPFWDCGWWSPSPVLAQAIAAATRAAARGESTRMETHYFAADGAERYIDLTLAPVTDDVGRVLFVAPTGSDVTDRRRAESELRDADRRKDDFLATLAHELRNPLAPIRTGLEIIKRAPPNSPLTVRARDTMERQLGHMVRLIDDLLDLSRIARGKIELRIQRLSLQQVIESAVEATGPAIAEGRHELVLELPDAPLWVEGDLTRLSQALGNILSNAAKYTPEPGRIALRAAEEQGFAVVRITDTGLGIARDMLERIFDMFAQLEHGGSAPERRKLHGGLGIGLALVRLLVEMHGGTAEADSPGPGRGSTFTVRLPMASPVLDESPELAGAAPGFTSSAGALRVLVVDDNVDGAELLAEMLALSGHETRTAHDGPSAIDAARRFEPQIVFLDIGLPGMDGHEVARALRAEPAFVGTTLVALTGWGSAEDRRRTAEAGFDHHLTKPVESGALESLLRQAALAKPPARDV